MFNGSLWSGLAVIQSTTFSSKHKDNNSNVNGKNTVVRKVSKANEANQ